MDRINKDIEKHVKIVNETLQMNANGELNLLDSMEVMMGIIDFARKLEPIWRRNQKIPSSADF